VQLAQIAYRCCRLLWQRCCLRRRPAAADETGGDHLFDVAHRQEVLDGGRDGQGADVAHERRDGQAAADGVPTEGLERRRRGRGDAQRQQNVGVVDEVEDDAVAQQRSQHVDVAVDADEQVDDRHVVVDDGAVDRPLAAAAAAAAAAVDTLIE